MRKVFVLSGSWVIKLHFSRLKPQQVKAWDTLDAVLLKLKIRADFQCFGGPRGIANRCRWNPIISNSVVAISFDGNFLNLVDPVKQTFLLKSPIILDDCEFIFQGNGFIILWNRVTLAWVGRRWFVARMHFK